VLFGALVLFLRTDTATPGAATESDSTVISDDYAYDDGSLGGGAISQPSQATGFPSAQTRTS
jgi:hypothetical protein